MDRKLSGRSIHALISRFRMAAISSAPTVSFPSRVKSAAAEGRRMCCGRYAGWRPVAAVRWFLREFISVPMEMDFIEKTDGDYLESGSDLRQTAQKTAVSSESGS